MGAIKALLFVNGEPVLARTQRALLSYGLRRVIVVLGENADAVRARVPLRACDVVINPAVDRGPFSSLQLALHHLAGEDASVPGAFVQPVDMPCASRDVYAALAAATEAPNAFAAVPTWRARGGHPVCMTPRGVAAVIRAPACARLDELLRAWGSERVLRVAVNDPSVCANWNTPADVSAPGRVRRTRGTGGER